MRKGTTSVCSMLLVVLRMGQLYTVGACIPALCVGVYKWIHFIESKLDIAKIKIISYGQLL